MTPNKNKLLLAPFLLILLPLFGLAEPTSPSKPRVSTDKLTPYFFPPSLNGLDTRITEFAYAFSSDGRRVDMGPVSFQLYDLFATLLPLSETEYLFLLKWPTSLITQGDLSITQITPSSQWTNSISEKSLYRWRKLKPSLNLTGAKAKIIEKANYGFKITKDELESGFPLNKPFVFCFTDPSSNGQHRSCSSPLALVGPNYQFKRLAHKVKPAVTLGGKPAPLRGIVPFEEGQAAMSFKAQLSDGSTYEFVSAPLRPVFHDILRLNETQQIELLGHGPRPFGNISESSRPLDINPLMERSYVLNRPELWAARFPETASFVYIPGDKGGYFRHPLFIESIPSRNHRLFAENRRVLRSYSEDPLVRIRNPHRQQFNIRGAQEITNDKGDEKSTLEAWSLKSAKKNEITTYLAEVADEKRVFKAEVPVFRAFQHELSAMFGVAGQETNLAMAGDARAKLWFETVLGCRNQWVCHQRWGARTRYFQSQSILDTGSGASTDLIVTSLQADLYYRLNRGVWGVDETWGLIAGFQRIEFNEFVSPRAGVGFIWGRPLPEIFEPIFELFPFMDYAKWVHMDFTYYPLSFDEDTSFDGGGANWTLNFQGRVEWTERVYGEVGFGLYNLDFILLEERKHIKSSAFFGTMGLGLRF